MREVSGELYPRLATVTPEATCSAEPHSLCEPQPFGARRFTSRFTAAVVAERNFPRKFGSSQ